MSRASELGQGTRRSLFAGILGLLLPIVVHAQAWPDRPVRLIVPYPPGGQTDLVTRFLAERLTQSLGEPVIVENKAGAQGLIGLEAGKNAVPDGYTFVNVTGSNISINPHVYPRLPYGLKDFEPVTQLGLSVLVMVVPAALNVKTLPEFFEHVRAHPGKATFASFGNGSTSHIYGEMLNGAARMDMVHVPYRGAGPAVQDVLAGHALMTIQDFGAVGAYIRSGALVPLAVTGPRRWPAFPEVRTFVEQGYALDLASWNGFMAPARTPRAIVERMSAEMNKIVKTPEGRERLLQMGLLTTGLAPEEFGEMLLRDGPRWGEVVRRAGIKPE